MSADVRIIACTEDDIEPWLYCEGCYATFKDDPAMCADPEIAEQKKARHETWCTAFRDWRIAQSLNLYAKLDGREEEFTPEGDPV